jgi:hypothetical protein
MRLNLAVLVALGFVCSAKAQCSGATVYYAPAPVVTPYVGSSYAFVPPSYSASHYVAPSYSSYYLPPADARYTASPAVTEYTGYYGSARRSYYLNPGPYYYTPTYSYTPGYYSYYYTPGYFRY